MEMRNAKRWAKGGPEPYVVGVLVLLAATAVRFSLQPYVEDHLPMLFYAINCIVIAFLYGFWPSFAMLLLALPTALFFFVKPYYAFSGVADSDIFTLIVYITLVVSAGLLLEWVRREQYKATLLARVSDTRYRLLVEADEDRRAVLKIVRS
jgi:K+-sensing histidine kinase KdpD